jgi:hypothetical protein
MWSFRRRSKDARNLLFDAALEFGENWRRGSPRSPQNGFRAWVKRIETL